MQVFSCKARDTCSLPHASGLLFEIWYGYHHWLGNFSHTPPGLPVTEVHLHTAQPGRVSIMPFVSALHESVQNPPGFSPAGHLHMLSCMYSAPGCLGVTPLL